jgi:hypothetical protein
MNQTIHHREARPMVALQRTAPGTKRPDPLQVAYEEGRREAAFGTSRANAKWKVDPWPWERSREFMRGFDDFCRELNERCKAIAIDPDR